MSVSAPRSVPVVIAAAACLLVLAGCARGAAAPVESASPVASATSTPTATPPEEHTIAFGGDCDAVLSEDQRASLFAVESTRVDADPGQDVGIGTLGGVECTWRGVDWQPLGADTAAVSVLAFPTSVIPQDLRAEAEAGTCIQIYDAMSCTLGADVGGVWLVVQAVQAAEEGVDTPAALLRSVLDAVTANTAGAIRPVPLARTVGWWSTDISCEDLGQRLGLADYLGSTYVTGWWEGDPSQEWTWRLLESAGVSLTCMWFPDFSDPSADPTYGLTSLQLSPGGAWAVDAALATGERTSLAGGLSAAVDGKTALAADGVNLARVSIGDSGTGDPTTLLLRVFDKFATSP
ncbi:hypothetical protein [Microbacterium sp. PM5]|uniref:hypothetical protein n=1 Tax=Microbacterium sp. PM5 TaxID=2014534 RepID=UPI000DD1098D|nr:hypothetical protein [Microbacterium sp. PM5]AXA97453.1 hypothetical protein CEP17_14105 [Microbacterium sp. PM5]MDC7803202.1 hypothetical protein [Sphingomonas sp. BLCC-B65]